MAAYLNNGVMAIRRKQLKIMAAQWRNIGVMASANGVMASALAIISAISAARSENNVASIMA